MDNPLLSTYGHLILLIWSMSGCMRLIRYIKYIHRHTFKLWIDNPNMVLWRVHVEPFSMCHDRNSNRPLHYMSPSQCPLVDKQHPASFAGTRPEVARRPWKVGELVVWNCPHVTCWYNRKFSKDTLNQYDVQSLFPVVKLMSSSYMIQEPMESKQPK